jgi:hypothetical protein
MTLRIIVSTVSSAVKLCVVMLSAVMLNVVMPECRGALIIVLWLIKTLEYPDELLCVNSINLDIFDLKLRERYVGRQ